MANPLNENYCCCQIFHITVGAYLICAHSFLQGTYGILVIITSYYLKKNMFVNMVAVAANICFFPAGIFVFASTLYGNYRAARFSALFFTLTTFFNFATSLCYLFWYISYEANSQLDKVFYWKTNGDWVARGELPFTFWHVLAVSIVLVVMLWFYYSLKLWKLAKLLKIKHDVKRKNIAAESSQKTAKPAGVSPKEFEA